MKIMWNHIVVAGVGGLLCGNLTVIARKHSNTTTYLLGCTAAFSTVGVATGVGVAMYRKAPIHVYGISVGANFAVSSFSFFGFRQILANWFLSQSGSPTLSEDAGSMKLKLLPWEAYFISGASGGLTGTLLSILSRCSVSVVISTGVGGVLVGLVGQMVYTMLNRWRIRRGVQLQYPNLAPPRKEWTLKRFEKWFLGFWHQTSKASRLEAQLSVLKNDIASEKRALASLDREAREHAGGESPSSSGCDDLT